MAKEKPVTLRDGDRISVTKRPTAIKVTQLPEYVHRPSRYYNDLLNNKE